MTAGAWRPLALSEELTGERPLAVVGQGQEIVLFRDAAGQARALEDRCPHRRVPLSLGVIQDGRLQCGYHGWTFEGAGGRCTAIPNLRPEERVPASYGVQAFPAAEADGFVQVWLGEGAPAASLPTGHYRPEGREFTGSAVVALAEWDYHDVLLDGPEHLVAIDEVHVTDFFLGDPRRDGDTLVLDRGAYWSSDERGDFASDYPLIVRTTVPVHGAVATVQLLNDDERPVFTLVLATAANFRGTTSLTWRGHAHADCGLAAPPAWRDRRVEGLAPFTVIERPDAAAIARLFALPSRELAAARAAAQDAPALVAV